VPLAASVRPGDHDGTGVATLRGKSPRSDDLWFRILRPIPLQFARENLVLPAYSGSRSARGLGLWGGGRGGGGGGLSAHLCLRRTSMKVSDGWRDTRFPGAVGSRLRASRPGHFETCAVSANAISLAGSGRHFWQKDFAVGGDSQDAAVPAVHLGEPTVRAAMAAFPRVMLLSGSRSGRRRRAV